MQEQWSIMNAYATCTQPVSHASLYVALIGHLTHCLYCLFCDHANCFGTHILQEVKLGVGYMSGGKRLAGMPSNLRILSGVEVCAVHSSIQNMLPHQVAYSS
jgi:hypothetical protein